MSWLDLPALVTAFFVGLLGSGHCFGMCGGIAAGLGSVPGGNKVDPDKPSALSAVLFNLGRVLGYAVLGFLSAWLLTRVGNALNVPRWSMILRLVTALMIFLIGLQYLTNWNLLGFIERVGTRVWKQVLPLAVKASAMPGGSGRMLLGLCWGFLPCGLVYSVVLTASAAGSPVAGALVMMAFGLGTLPSMLGVSLAAPALSAMLNDRWARKLMGTALILLAVLSLSLMYVKVQGKQGHHHMSVENMQTMIVPVRTLALIC